MSDEAGEGFEYIEVGLGAFPPPTEKCPRPESCPNLAAIRQALGQHSTVQAQCPDCHRLIRIFRTPGVR